MSYNDLQCLKIEILRRAVRHGSERTGPGICMSFFAGVYSCSLIAQPNLIPPDMGILHIYIYIIYIHIHIHIHTYIYIVIHTNTGLDGFQNWTQIWRPHDLRNELLRRAYRNQHPDTRFVNSECAGAGNHSGDCWMSVIGKCPILGLLDITL